MHVHNTGVGEKEAYNFTHAPWEAQWVKCTHAHNHSKIHNNKPKSTKQSKWRMPVNQYEDDKCKKEDTSMQWTVQCKSELSLVIFTNESTLQQHTQGWENNEELLDKRSRRCRTLNILVQSCVEKRLTGWLTFWLQSRLEKGLTGWHTFWLQSCVEDIWLQSCVRHLVTILYWKRTDWSTDTLVTILCWGRTAWLTDILVTVQCWRRIA